VTANPALSSPARALACAIGALAASCRQPTPPPTIAAAADLSAAFTEIGDAFAKAGGVKPVFTFGSTGLLAKQLEQGAPFDVFAAANVSFVDRVVQKGACDGATRSMYGRGRIVLFTRSGHDVTPPASIADLGDARFKRVAIANPEHAPYGKAAQQALEHAGVWDAVKPKLVFGENVQQAVTFATTGNVDVAIVALSLAKAAKDATYTEVDQALYSPIDQALVVCRNGKSVEAGRKFAEFVSGPSGREIMKRAGFLLPNETPGEPR
jgi:molybdate transport system substrate-binding protein